MYLCFIVGMGPCWKSICSTSLTRTVLTQIAAYGEDGDIMPTSLVTSSAEDVIHKPDGSSRRNSRFVPYAILSSRQAICTINCPWLLSLPGAS